ncbi:hypothetical protein ACM714_27525 [Pseudomonas aeruginosa]|nr:hypothetical protein [Pseudomonas aeruginosa]HCL3292886.1 hypothetical protein [Pseudomonas aeruginosa]
MKSLLKKIIILSLLFGAANAWAGCSAYIDATGTLTTSTGEMTGRNPCIITSAKRSGTGVYIVEVNDSWIIYAGGLEARGYSAICTVSHAATGNLSTSIKIVPQILPVGEYPYNPSAGEVSKKVEFTVRTYQAALGILPVASNAPFSMTCI